MPELPEVETVRLFLQSNILHKTIINVEIINDSSFHGEPKLILNSQVVDFHRKGKQLTILFDNQLALMFHLKMTGQLIYIPSSTSSRTVLGHPTKNAATSSLPDKSTRVIFTFSDSSVLYFNDQRKFGWVRLIDPKDLPQLQLSLGPDILSPEFTFSYFQSALKKTSRPIKLALLDQQKFAGIGNIYANDALWESKIHPLTPSNQIPSSKLHLLYDSVIDIIQESIQNGGSTAKDNKYLRPDGSFGQHQFHFRVYQREGESCSRCHTPIQRLKFAGRSSWFCPKCQKL